MHAQGIPDMLNVCTLHVRSTVHSFAVLRFPEVLCNAPELAEERIREQGHLIRCHIRMPDLTTASSEGSTRPSQVRLGQNISSDRCYYQK